MRKKSTFLIVLLLLSLFITSCSDKRIEEAELGYQEKDYGRAVRICDEILSEELVPEALYWKAMSYYKMGNSREAFDAALLYGMLSDNDEEHWYDAMRLILHTSRDDRITISAGGELYSRDMMTKQDYISYYTALARQKEEKLAEEVYVKVTPMMKASDIALMNVLAEAPSLRIISSLDKLYQTEGLSEDFIEVVMLSIPLFINRGEGILLYDTVKRGFGSNYAYALYIGDLMFSLGKKEEAAIYWYAASSEYPEEAAERLSELGY